MTVDKDKINEKADGLEYTANISDGQITNTDFNSDIDAEKGWGDVSTFGEYEKISKTDGLICGILNAVNSSIFSADFDFVGGEEKHREHLRSVFFKFLNPSFPEFVQQVLQYLVFGHMVFEIIHEREGKYLYIKKISQRLPKTICRWNYDLVSGDLKSITQWVYDIDGSLKSLDVDSNNLLIFTHKKEGRLYTGTSTLRAAWNLVHKKQHALKVWSIANQREGAGIPFADRRKETLDDTPSNDEVTLVKTILREMQAHQRQYLIGTKNYTFSYLYNENKTDFTSFITQLDMQIALSFLAQFFLLGNTSSGNRALADTQQTVFDDMNTGIANYIASVINGVKNQIGTGIIRMLIDYTWGVQNEYPQLKFSNVKKFDSKNFIENIVKAAQVGAVSVTENLIDHVHKILGLPEKDDTAEPTISEKSEKLHLHDNVKLSVSNRILTPLEKCFELELTDRKFDKFIEKYQLSQVNFRTDILNEFIKKAKLEINKAIKSQDYQAVAIDNIKKISVSNDIKEKYSKEFSEILGGFVSFTKRELERELSKQSEFLDDVKSIKLKKKLDTDNTIKTLSTEVLVDDMIDQTLEFVEGRANSVGLNASIEMIRTGQNIEKTIKNGMKTFVGREEKSWAELLSSRVFNTARENHVNEVMKKIPNSEVSMVEYSAIMDKQTCDPCELADRDYKHVKYGSELHKTILPPYRKCVGSLRCRCILLYQLK